MWYSFSLPGVIKLGWSGLLYAYCRRGQQLQVGFSVLIYLQNLSIPQRGFGRGARVLWEQQLQFGLPNLMCTIKNVHLFYRSRRAVWLRASAPSMRLTLGYFGLLYRSNWNISAWCGSMGCRWVCTISSMQQVYCPPQSSFGPPRRNLSGVAAACGIFRPHPFIYEMDSAELFGETLSHSVGAVLAGGLFRARSPTFLENLT